jgi:hypothetical protein
VGAFLKWEGNMRHALDNPSNAGFAVRERARAEKVQAAFQTDMQKKFASTEPLREAVVDSSGRITEEGDRWLMGLLKGFEGPV